MQELLKKIRMLQIPELEGRNLTASIGVALHQKTEILSWNCTVAQTAHCIRQNAAEETDTAFMRRQ